MAPNGPNGQQFLVAKEAAGIARVHVQTLYRWLRHPDKKQRPPVRRFSRNCLRFPADKFMEWKRERDQGEP
jgi:hypothetical protein